MSLKTILNAPLRLRIQRISATRWFASESKDELVSVDEEPILLQSNLEYEEEMESKRNKSRLAPQHRNILMGVKPYDEPIEWFHNTVKYKKRTLGRYGLKNLGVPAGLAWPTPKEVEDMKEYERVAYPLSLQDSWKQIKEKHDQEAAFKRERQEDVAAKMAKMDQWITELNDKIAKKEAEMLAAKARKQKLIDEVRRHFGFDISPHDERFKEMLAKKEKEDKKKMKEAKKAARAERLAQRVQEIYKEQGIEDGASITPKEKRSKRTKDASPDPENLA